MVTDSGHARVHEQPGRLSLFIIYLSGFTYNWFCAYILWSVATSEAFGGEM